MKHRHSATIHSTILYTICAIAFVYTLHLTLPMYVNSSFLGQFTNEGTVGVIYILGAIATIIGFLSTSHILTKFGNEKTTLGLVLIQMGIFYGLSTGTSLYVIAPLFILNSAVVSMIGLNLDIFLEVYTDSQHTGGIRGLYMTVINAAWIMSPLLSGILVDGGNNYHIVYYAAFSLLFLLMYMIHKNFRNFKDPHYPHISMTHTLAEVGKHHSMSRLFFANTILNIFYAWMVIYSPVYLHKTMGMSWDDIGIIFTIMLLPFVIFELPLGKLADKKLGEKEIMTAGFILTGVATFMLSYIHTSSVLVWAIALFITRVGASAAETMIETYFFKKVDPKETNVLSVFRITRPLAFVIAPVITSVGLLYFTNSTLFMVLGVIVLSSLFFTLTLRDTK